MANGPSYRVKFRRRRLGRTNYYRRVGLISSGIARLVIRRSNRYVLVQLITSDQARDRIVASASSRELKLVGYPTGLSSAPACYLTGHLIGLRALQKGVKEAIADLGEIPKLIRTDVYAVVKGCIDAGVSVRHGEGVFPADERLNGEHIAAYAKSLKEGAPDRYAKLFSNYLKAGISPESLPSLVASVRKELIKLL